MSSPNPDPSPEPQSERLWRLFLVSALVIMAAPVLAAYFMGPSPGPVVDNSDFYDWIQAGKVESIIVKGTSIQGVLRAPEVVEGHPTTGFRTTALEGDATLLPLLREKKVHVRAENDSNSFVSQLLVSVLPVVILVGFWIWMSRRTAALITSSPAAQFMKPKSHKFEKSRSPVTFAQVAGLQTAKRDLQEVVQFLKEPERFRRLGGKIPRGVLLVGPPGTGKTFLARAVAGESGVPFFSISASEFIEMFVGVGAARVRDLFQEAKKEAPAILFIDEIDAVGRSRGTGVGGGQDEREQTLNQLLSEMDGFDRTDSIIVMAATNRPDVLDPALLRPGRFDRHVMVERPERTARRAILDVHVKGKPLATDVDLDGIARDTPGFSGADLENLVNEAALRATRRGADAIAASDFSEAYDRIVLGDPKEGKLDADEKRRVAFHESGHALVARLSPSAEPVQRITIIPRGMALGVTQQTPTEERHMLTEPQLVSRLQVLMGGYAAERLVFGNISSGAANDLKEATGLASKMVSQYGMSEAIGPVYYEHDVEHPFLGRRMAVDGAVSDRTMHSMEDETRRILALALQSAGKLLGDHRATLDRLAAVLIEKETIEGAELREALA